ncbi:MAG TPA: o-succinylbenzoate synthase [Acidimicrobiales bacterium]|nr:o-succinylbenzoate synthase [Acidimicrobiales bacterium]
MGDAEIDRRLTADESLTGRWRRIGSGHTVELDAVTLWMTELPLVRPIATAKGIHRRRPLVFVQVSGRSRGRAVEGWGECAALGDAGYDREDDSVASEALERTIVPALFEQVAGDAHRLPPPSALGPVRQFASGTPLAFAALEMAVADAHLRAEGRSMAELLGVDRRTVELGAVAGLAPSPAGLVERIGELVEAGFARVKVKVAPGTDVGDLEAVRRSWPGLRLQADANGSYGAGDDDHLRGLDRFDLLCLEQPFDRMDLAAHARLAVRMRTPICLDESFGSPADVVAALAMGACSVVCVKPARLGGLGAALQVIESCAAAGVPLWMGGMFESGYARAVNTTLGALAGFAWPGDLSPAATYLRDDVVPGPRLSRCGSAGALAASVPPGPGMGPAPEAHALARHPGRRVVMEAS